MEAREGSVPYAEQMVTMWPGRSAEAAGLAREVDRAIACRFAVEPQDDGTARRAIETARRAAEGAGAATEPDIDWTRRGPYLLAGSPVSAMGKDDALLLGADLSNVTSFATAEREFILWREEVVKRPEDWKTGWTAENIRRISQRFLDRKAETIIVALGLK